MVSASTQVIQRRKWGCFGVYVWKSESNSWSFVTIEGECVLKMSSQTIVASDTLILTKWVCLLVCFDSPFMMIYMLTGIIILSNNSLSIMCRLGEARESLCPHNKTLLSCCWAKGLSLLTLFLWWLIWAFESRNWCNNTLTVELGDAGMVCITSCLVVHIQPLGWIKVPGR